MVPAREVLELSSGEFQPVTAAAPQSVLSTWSSVTHAKPYGVPLCSGWRGKQPRAQHQKAGNGSHALSAAGQKWDLPLPSHQCLISLRGVSHRATPSIAVCSSPELQTSRGLAGPGKELLQPHLLPGKQAGRSLISISEDQAAPFPWAGVGARVLQCVQESCDGHPTQQLLPASQCHKHWRAGVSRPAFPGGRQDALLGGERQKEPIAAGERGFQLLPSPLSWPQDTEKGRLWS
ncbi:Hypothetical predicted protein [Podarcis lilfordi]|uniref:Uncharacterized protein n=1 Tax=Podarcis lilfordi TaxID=74358 RepID=A0AA35PEK8_9SAUR|nr:Hypothetical predicted protein [Podarcis lilfordi]